MRAYAIPAPPPNMSTVFYRHAPVLLSGFQKSERIRGTFEIRKDNQNSMPSQWFPCAVAWTFAHLRGSLLTLFGLVLDTFQAGEDAYSRQNGASIGCLDGEQLAYWHTFHSDRKSVV